MIRARCSVWCYSVFIMFRHLALHDFFHAYRIEELLLKREWSPLPSRDESLA